MAEDRNVETKKTETAPRTWLRPVTTICECEGDVVLTAEMPGVAKDGLDIQVDNDQLIIRGSRHVAAPEGRFIVRERQSGDYYRSYTLDETVDRERISASMKNGVVTVTLRLREAAKPRKIQVKSS